MIMQTPTPRQLCTAIEVLKMLGERINTDAAHMVNILPDTLLGNDYAAKIDLQTIEQTTQIESVAMRLENWHDELQQQREQNVSQHV
jgi:hypothetical protein